MVPSTLAVRVMTIVLGAAAVAQPVTPVMTPVITSAVGVRRSVISGYRSLRALAKQADGQWGLQRARQYMRIPGRDRKWDEAKEKRALCNVFHRGDEWGLNPAANMGVRFSRVCNPLPTILVYSNNIGKDTEYRLPSPFPRSLPQMFSLTPIRIRL